VNTRTYIILYAHTWRRLCIRAGLSSSSRPYTLIRRRRRQQTKGGSDKTALLPLLRDGQRNTNKNDAACSGLSCFRGAHILRTTVIIIIIITRVNTRYIYKYNILNCLAYYNTYCDLYENTRHTRRCRVSRVGISIIFRRSAYVPNEPFAPRRETRFETSRSIIRRDAVTPM